MFLLCIGIVSARKNCYQSSQTNSIARNTSSIEMSSDLRKCQNDAITTFDVRRSEGESRTNLSLCTGSGKTRIIQEISQTERRIIIVFPWLALLKQFWDDQNNPFKNHKCVRYLATEGTIEGVKRLDTKMDELDASDYVILTTYTSAPEVYRELLTEEGRLVDLLIHDEAHRVKRDQYSASLATIEERIGHRVDLSATLPEPADYKYSLLRGIKDKVVRDFNMEIFLCTDAEREQSKLFVEIVKQLQTIHPISVKLLVYTAEANTDGENRSSVKSYLDQNMAAAVENGWWMKGLYEETMSERTRILREFQEERRVSILVSCRTISEGVDLKNANCMMPWDASKSPIDNIQRIGRVLRLYKNREGNLCPEHAQLPSTVFIPVFLEMSKFETCGGDRQCIHDVLEKEIELNDNGNFVPFTTVCAALKDELADEDEDLFNELINMPPKPKHTRNAVECLAKHLRKSVDEVIDEMCGCGGGGDFVDTVRSNDWDDDDAAAMFDLLAMSQGVALVVDDGENRVRYGDGEECVVLKKNDKDDGYKVVKDNKAAHDKKALERVSNRTRVGFSCGFTILFGLDDVDEELVSQEKNFIATKLSVTVQPDANWEKNRQKRNSFFESNGREPSNHASNKEEKSIAKWISHQRTGKKHFDNKDKKSHITQERIDILNDPEQTPGWKWDADNWVENHQQRNSFFESNGREPSQCARNPDGTPNIEERPIANWISGQRTQRRKFDNGNEAYITQERIDILNDPVQTPGWKWENDLEGQWVETHQQRNSFFESNGREPSQCARNPDGTPNIEERPIANWICCQRTQKKKFDKGEKASITQEHIDILNDPEQTPGWKWEIDFEGQWAEKHQQRNSFFKTNGREPSTKAKNHVYYNEEEKSIANWIGKQRDGKKKFDNKENPAYITQERIDILNDPEQTPGWKWENDLEGQWVETHQQRNSFFETNGIEPSPRAENPDGTPNIEERSKANWISNQRAEKKKFDKGEKSRITQERIDILNDPVQTPGWKWEKDLKGRWADNHQKRNWFFESSGREPIHDSKNPDGTHNKEERSIGKWISHQRDDKKKFDKGEKSPITQERIDILNDPVQTPGWKWDADNWVNSHQQRNSFFESSGKDPSSCAKNIDDAPDKEARYIGGWISNQRVQKKKFDKGEKSSITQERIDILNDPEQTPGWKWDADNWVDNHQQRNSFFESNGREPTQHSKTPDETYNKKWHSIAGWINTQRLEKKKFDKGEKAHITKERIDILNDPEQTPGWKWEKDLKGQWVESHQQRNSFFETNGREPSPSAKNPDETPNIEERSNANWISRQRSEKNKFDKGKKSKITKERIDILNDPVQTPGWKWDASKKRTEPRNAELLESDMDHASAAIIPAVTPMAAVEPQKTIKRKPKRKVKLQIEKTYRNCSHQTSSKLTDFHRRFKSMKSTNYNATNVSREDFDTYHQEADKYDARDAEEIQACANVERLLLDRKPKCNRKTYHAIDLGCGMNRFRHRESVQKMSWEALDIHAVDETVTVGNIGDMTELYEDEEFDVVIANRVLWGTDHDTMLSEIHRIMKTGGVVVFCEAVGRWIKKSEDKKTNILSNEIERCGMKIVKQEGTDICEDGTHDLWQYIVATKH